MIEGGFALGSRGVQPHVVVREPEGIIRVVLAGDVTEADIRQFVAAFTRDEAEPGDLSLIADVTLLGTLSPAARKESTRVDLSAVARIGFVGASYRLRVLLDLTQRAFELLTGRPATPTGFFATESEARAWIAAERNARQAPR